MRDNVVLVAVDQASFHFDKLYSYRLPPSAGEVTRGCRVLVPLRRRQPPAAGHRGAHRHGGGYRPPQAHRPGAGKGTAAGRGNDGLALWLKERTLRTVFDAVRACCPSGLYMRLRPLLRLAPKAEDRLEEMTPEERQIVSFLAKCPAAGVEQETLLKKLGLNPDAPGLLGCSNGDRAAVGGRFPPGGGRLHPYGAPGSGGGGAGRGAERLHR